MCDFYLRNKKLFEQLDTFIDSLEMVPKNLFPDTVRRCLWFSAASILLKVKIMIS